MIVPFFGEMITERVSAADIKRWRKSLLEAGYKRAYVNSHHRVLKLVLKHGGNDCAYQVKALNEKSDARTNRQEPNLLTAEELDRFLAIAKEDWPQHFALILVLFTTTARISSGVGTPLGGPRLQNHGDRHKKTALWRSGDSGRETGPFWGRLPAAFA